MTASLPMLVTMALAVGACARPPMLPMCEAAAYGGITNSQLSDAIDALRGGDAAAVADLVKAADVNLAAAESRLAEVRRSPGDYAVYAAQLEEALALSRGLQVALGTGATAATDAQAQLEQAQATLMEIGPAAGCADLSSPGPTENE